MTVVVVFESVYGNTRAIAEAVAEGLREELPGDDIIVAPAGDHSRELAEQADLVVVGGPTHVHGVGSKASRRAAVQGAQKHRREHELAIEGQPLKQWLETLAPPTRKLAAAFDTRIDRPRLVTGAASLGIGRRLSRIGYELAGEPESFVVSGSEGPLREDEPARARAWGATLARELMAQRALLPAR